MKDHRCKRRNADAKPNHVLCLKFCNDTRSIRIAMNSLFRTILVTAWATLLLSRAAHATRASLLQASCEYNTYMCCWTENDDNGVEDNTDVCE